jgi:hypothetical protein
VPPAPAVRAAEPTPEPAKVPPAEPKVKPSKPPAEPAPVAVQAEVRVLPGFPVFVGCFPESGPTPRDLDIIVAAIEPGVLAVERNQDGKPVRHYGLFDYNRGPALIASYLRTAIERDGWEAVLGTAGVHIDKLQRSGPRKRV